MQHNHSTTNHKVPDYDFRMPRQITYPLFEIEFETGKIISPFVLSKKDWKSRHKITPFYANVQREGVIL